MHACRSTLEDPTDLEVESGSYPTSIPTVGDSIEAGTEMVTVGAGTFLAWKITSAWSQDFSDTGGELEERESTFWYVEGLGIVKEVTTDASDDHVVIQKELTAYSGL